MQISNYVMFLDDERDPAYPCAVVVRNMHEAILYIHENGVPEFIDFDHDLCDLFSGYDFAKWLVKTDMEHDWWKSKDDFGFGVHSQNPIGRESIYGILENYKDYKFG